ACAACLTRSAASRAFNFERPASSGAIASSSSTSFSDSSNRPVFANDFTARSSIANRWTVPGSRGTGEGWREGPIFLCRDASVPRHLGFDLLRPLVDPADEILHLPEAERSEEHTSELQSLAYLVCRLLLEKKNT